MFGFANAMASGDGIFNGGGLAIFDWVQVFFLLCILIGGIYAIKKEHTLLSICIIIGAMLLPIGYILLVVFAFGNYLNFGSDPSYEQIQQFTVFVVLGTTSVLLGILVFVIGARAIKFYGKGFKDFTTLEHGKDFASTIIDDDEEFYEHSDEEWSILDVIRNTNARADQKNIN
eukprot:TRINITY_DN4742_c0_g1_i1.p2 TRINITY_DN4742_c0_g1~~TRINITY_DN4742_c0_g1_i1.p2  ORF type:complete len:173 (-),score=34.30 TRINITY_DN4742_c0_g1_i1:25-543(-)